MSGRAEQPVVSPEELARIQTEFARRSRRQLAISLPVVGLIALLAGARHGLLGLSEATVGPIAAGLVVLAVGLSLWNWRCPGCRRYLGKRFSPRFCAGCGVKLRA